MEMLTRPFTPDAATYARRLDELITRPVEELATGPLYGPRLRAVRHRDHVRDPQRRAELYARSLDLLRFGIEDTARGRSAR